MTYLGEVRNGGIVLRNAPSLEEGTLVRVEPLTARARPVRRGSSEAVQQCDARWVGEPEELDRLLAEVQRARDADLTPAGKDQ
jgi:hypothetical protein